MSKHKTRPPIEVIGKPRLLRSGAPTAPVCKAMLTWMDGEREWKTRCNRAFADKQEVCKCGAKRPKSTDEDHGYTHSTARSLRGSGEEVAADEQKRYSVEALERRESFLAQDKERLVELVAEIRSRAPTARQRKRLKSIQHQINAIVAESA